DPGDHPRARAPAPGTIAPESDRAGTIAPGPTRWTIEMVGTRPAPAAPRGKGGRDRHTARTGHRIARSGGRRPARPVAHPAPGGAAGPGLRRQHRRGAAVLPLAHPVAAPPALGVAGRTLRDYRGDRVRRGRDRGRGRAYRLA